MVNRQRKLLMKKQCSLYLDYTKVYAVIEELQAALKDYGASAEIRKYHEPYDESEYIGIFAEEPETDQEWAARVDREEVWEARQEERDRKEFERLQAKYNNEKQ